MKDQKHSFPRRKRLWSSVTARVMKGLPLMCLSALLLQTLKARAEDYPVAGFERLILVVPHANVNIIAGTQPVVHVQGGGGGWSAREDGTSIRIVGGLGVSQAKPSVARVDITVPPMALEIHVQEGNVNVQKWSKPFLVDLQRGKIAGKENRARGILALGQGSISVIDHQGSLAVDAYKGDISITKFSGNLEASVFSGEVKIDELSGLLDADIFQGNLKVTKSSGTVEFQSGKAGTLITDFKGRIEGDSREGLIQIDALPDSEIVVKNDQGRIVLTSKQSGSMLMAQSEEGDIQSPRTMKVGKDKTARVLRGRLKGKNSIGRIELLAQKAMIVVKD